MNKLILIFTIVSFSSICQAKGAFDSIKCDQPSSFNFIGKKSPSGHVVDVEDEYKNIQLKNEGGMIINDEFFLIEWKICGKSHNMILDKEDIIQDAISFEHSRKYPSFFGACKVNNRQLPGVHIALLELFVITKPLSHFASDDTTLEKVREAWLIDEKTWKIYVNTPFMAQLHRRIIRLHFYTQRVSYH